MTEAETLPVERRGAARFPVRFPVTLERLETVMVSAEARDLSVSGMLVHSAVELPIWAGLMAALPGVEARRVRIVRRNRNDYGCLFQTPLTEDELKAVLASDQALIGVERLRIEAEAPPVPSRRRVLSFWRR